MSNAKKTAQEEVTEWEIANREIIKSWVSDVATCPGYKIITFYSDSKQKEPITSFKVKL